MAIFNSYVTNYQRVMSRSCDVHLLAVDFEYLWVGSCRPLWDTPAGEVIHPGKWCLKAEINPCWDIPEALWKMIPSDNVTYRWTIAYKYIYMCDLPAYNNLHSFLCRLRRLRFTKFAGGWCLKIVVYCTVTSCCSVRRMRKHWKVVGLSDFFCRKNLGPTVTSDDSESAGDKNDHTLIYNSCENIQT